MLAESYSFLAKLKTEGLNQTAVNQLNFITRVLALALFKSSVRWKHLSKAKSYISNKP